MLEKHFAVQLNFHTLIFLRWVKGPCESQEYPEERISCHSEVVFILMFLSYPAEEHVALVCKCVLYPCALSRCSVVIFLALNDSCFANKLRSHICSTTVNAASCSVHYYSLRFWKENVNWQLASYWLVSARKAQRNNTIFQFDTWLSFRCKL